MRRGDGFTFKNGENKRFGQKAAHSHEASSIQAGMYKLFFLPDRTIFAW